MFFTTFCTLMLISCMVLVTSSIAEAACTLTLADSSEAPAIWFEPAETCDALSRVVRTISCKPCDIRRNALPSVSRFERGVNFHGQVAFGNGHGNSRPSPSGSDHVVEGGRQCADFVVTVNVDVLIQIA